jgi:hypothetical protein
MTSGVFGVNPDGLNSAYKPFQDLSGQVKAMPGTLGNELSEIPLYPSGQENDPTVKQLTSWYEPMVENLMNLADSYGKSLDQVSGQIVTSAKAAAQAGSETTDMAKTFQSGMPEGGTSHPGSGRA